MAAAKTRDFAAAIEPAEADLAAYLAGHPEAFREDRKLTFRQVYLDPVKRGERLEADAARCLAELESGEAQADASACGDPTLLPAAFSDEPQRGVEAAFGRGFAAKLGKLPLGKWSGPVPSGIGAHLVLVEQRTEGRLPALDDVREHVRREWENARRIEARRKFLEDLLESYEITVECRKGRRRPAR